MDIIDFCEWSIWLDMRFGNHRYGLSEGNDKEMLFGLNDLSDYQRCSVDPLHEVLTPFRHFGYFTRDCTRKIFLLHKHIAVGTVTPYPAWCRGFQPFLPLMVRSFSVSVHYGYCLKGIIKRVPILTLRSSPCESPEDFMFSKILTPHKHMTLILRKSKHCGLLLNFLQKQTSHNVCERLTVMLPTDAVYEKDMHSENIFVFDMEAKANVCRVSFYHRDITFSRTLQALMDALLVFCDVVEKETRLELTIQRSTYETLSHDIIRQHPWSYVRLFDCVRVLKEVLSLPVPLLDLSLCYVWNPEVDVVPMVNTVNTDSLLSCSEHEDHWDELLSFGYVRRTDGPPFVYQRKGME